MHHHKRSRVLVIQQVHKLKQPVFVLRRVNSEVRCLTSSSFHTQRWIKKSWGGEMGEARKWPSETFNLIRRNLSLRQYFGDYIYFVICFQAFDKYPIWLEDEL